MTNDPAPAVPVGVQPEPAEERIVTCPECPHQLLAEAGTITHNDDGYHTFWPAVPVVQPEPASESSDSVAELVADTTRSGDRAGNWYRVLYEDKSANRVGYVSLVMAEADREVAAAVAAVRADTEVLAARIEADGAGTIWQGASDRYASWLRAVSS